MTTSFPNEWNTKTSSGGGNTGKYADTPWDEVRFLNIYTQVFATLISQVTAHEDVLGLTPMQQRLKSVPTAAEIARKARLYTEAGLNELDGVILPIDNRSAS